jgi:DNA-binding response OmpR family regulator
MADGTGKQKIVIVEDNNALADIYKTRLELIGYTCYIAYNGIIGLYFIQKEMPDLVLLDLMVPDIAGDQILQHMRVSDWGKEIPVYVISNLNEADAPTGLRELGISGYAVKANLSNDQIDQIVNSILRPNGGSTPHTPAVVVMDSSDESSQPTTQSQPIEPVAPPEDRSANQ